MSGSSLGVFAAGFFQFLAPSPAPAPVEPGPGLGSAPVLLWSAALEGGPLESAVRTEPGGIAFDRDNLYVGFSGADALLVLDRRDGSIVGRLPAKGTVVSTPVVAGDRVWFADDAGYTWSYARDTARGTPEAVWSHYSGAPIVSSPRVQDGLLLVANVDEQVYALDAATGELRWRHAHKLDAARSASLELFGAPSPVVAGDQVLVGFSDGFLVSLGLADGEESWRAGVGEGTYPDIIAPPLPVAGGVVAGGFSEPLVSVDPSNRAVRWRVDAGTGSALLLDGELLWQGGADGTLRRIDPRTGEVQLSWVAPEGGTLTEPVATPLGILVGSSVGTLYLVDAQSGIPSWTFSDGELVVGVTGRPAVDGDLVYFVSNAGRVYALRGRAPATGTPGSWFPASRTYRTTPTPRR